MGYFEEQKSSFAIEMRLFDWSEIYFEKYLKKPIMFFVLCSQIVRFSAITPFRE